MILNDLQKIEEALKSNDKESFFEVLYIDYVPYGLRAVKSFDLRPLTPEDVIQDVLSDWQKKELSYFKIEKLRSLMVVSCVNKAKDLLKRRKGWDYKVEFSEMILNAPDLTYENHLVGDTINYYLQRLKPKYRNVLMDYIDGYKLAEIAEKRSMNLSTVKSYKLKAQHYLRCYLANDYEL